MWKEKNGEQTEQSNPQSRRLVKLIREKATSWRGTLLLLNKDERKLKRK